MMAIPDEALTALAAQGLTPDELIADGYTLTNNPAGLCCWKLIPPYFEGHCITGGAACIDWLIAEAHTRNLTPLTTVDVKRYRPIYNWLRRKRGFVDLVEAGTKKVLIIPLTTG